MEVIVSLGGAGSIRGTRDSNGVCRFLGIPYAQPPTGERRWKKPAPLPSNFSYDVEGKPGDGTKFGDICAQEKYVIDGKVFNEVPGGTYSEDCLLVNIWTPAQKPNPGESWPVLAFLHGGWLQVGSPSVDQKLHPEELLSPNGIGLNAVVVSIGYRLNMFGFLAGDGVDGNFGFWDQRAALQWIQEKIQFFGGDASKVTLFGHSAGGFSAHTHLQYELLHTDGKSPLFKSVFLCSNAIPAQPKTRAEANAQLQEVYKTVGISESLTSGEKLQALRQVPTSELVAVLPKLKMSNFRAVTDNDLIHADMTARFEDGTLAKGFRDRGYRLMTGETETEQFLYSRWLPPKTEEELPIKLQNYYAAGVVDKLLAHPGYQGQGIAAFGRIVSDMQVRAPVRILCRQLFDAGVPSERLLRYRVAFRPGFFDQIYPPEAGVTHGADLYMWWAAKRMGYTEDEWSALKQWLKASLVKLVNGEQFESGIDARKYLLFTPDGKVEMTDDASWEHLMSVMDAVSK